MLGERVGLEVPEVQSICDGRMALPRNTWSLAATHLLIQCGNACRQVLVLPLAPADVTDELSLR